jgi:hypothetical protein
MKRKIYKVFHEEKSYGWYCSTIGRKIAYDFLFWKNKKLKKNNN